MNKTKTLEPVRNLTPDVVLNSPVGRLKIAMLQLVARLLPGRFAVWLSLLDDGQLERQARIKFGLRSLFPSGGYDVPRLHLIVEWGDWLTLALNDTAASTRTISSLRVPPATASSSTTFWRAGLRVDRAGLGWVERRVGVVSAARR